MIQRDVLDNFSIILEVYGSFSWNGNKDKFKLEIVGKLSQIIL
ncbi:MAG: hypothetical protein OCD02_10525 [Spirochaetaceae bacterium]